MWRNLKRQGLCLAAVSYDAVAVLADFSKRRGITFPLLSDPGSATIKQYGIFNTTVPETNQQNYSIPFPGTLMLSTQGVVTSRFFEQAYQERNTVGSIMARLGNKVNVQATTVSSPQLEMTSFATDSTVASGRDFPGPDVRPARGVHVYAPGVIGQPIALSVEAQPGLVTRGAQYPPSEDYHFKPLNEHVQVYQRPFRIVQDVLIDPSPEGLAALKDGSSLAIKGVLNYQACDDKVCFTPQSVPLRWTVALRQLDRERAKP